MPPHRPPSNLRYWQGIAARGRAGTVAPCFGLAVKGGVWACAEAMMATNINVAVSIDLMTILRSIDENLLKHILEVQVIVAGKGKFATC
jgi:hypothetical protein